MKHYRLLLLYFMGVIMAFSLFGCRKPKYKLILDGSFESRKTEYAEGETVTVYFSMIATDTDYHFWLDDESVDMKQNYDERHGYVFTFSMPAHDVTLHEESHNSMVYQPEYALTLVNEAVDADIWILPQTEANLKTSVWGTATVGSLGKGETAEISLRETYAADSWMIRIIDKGHALYSANDLLLSDGYQIVFRTESSLSEAVIEVTDREGTLIFSKPAFSGVLGGD